VMRAALAVIDAIGFVFERLIFGSIERATVMRWGMVRAAKGRTGRLALPRWRDFRSTDVTPGTMTKMRGRSS